MRFLTTTPAFLAMAVFLCASCLWSATDGVEGFQIIVKRQPACSECAGTAVMSDKAGRVRFEIAEPGSYSIEAVAALPRDFRSDVRDVRLRGTFWRKTPGDGPLVTGKTVDGAWLFAAGADRGDGSVLFSTNVTVAAPASFVGRIETDSDVTLDARHLTFYSIVDGPLPAAQSVTISNASASAVGYTAGFETVGPDWAATLSKSSGSIGGGRTDAIELRLNAALPEGQYNGFLRLRFQTGDGPLERVAAVSLLVQRKEDSKAATLVDGPMAVVFPLPSDDLEASVLRVTNNSARAQKYGLEPDQGLTFTPSEMTLNPGESGAFMVQATETTQPVAARAATGRWEERCVWVIDLNIPLHPRVLKKCYWVWVGGSAALSAACAPTGLQPVITHLTPQVPRAGHPLEVAVRVFDDCGGQLDDFTAILSVNNGAGQSILTAVQSSARAITKGGVNFLRSGPRRVAQNARAETAPELRIDGYLHPYFRVGEAGLTLKVDVEAPNPAGGDRLIGSVEMPLPFDSDSVSPLLAQGAFVNNTNYESTPLAPFEVFSLFTIIPGLTPEEAQAVPFPASLAGVQLLIDGRANVPLIRALFGQVPGILPDLATGTHIVNVLYNERMSGAIEFDVAPANPSPLYIDLAAGTPHLYDEIGGLVTRDNPVRAGRVFAFYANGLGRMKGIDQVAGATTPLELMEAEEPCKLTIGANAPELFYCGRGPGSVALDQINFRLTAISAPGASPGDVVQIPIVLDQGGNEGSVKALGWFEVNQAQSTVNISFQANYPDARFFVDNQLITGGTALTVNSGASILLDVPADPQQPAVGTRYSFYGWSQGGARQQAIAPTVNSAYGAYFLASYLLTIDGAAVTNPPSPDGYYRQTANNFISVTVSGACLGGATPIALLVSTASGSVTLPNPSMVIMDKPTTVTVQCPPPPPVGSCTVAPEGLIGWWPLDELTGTVARNLGSLAGADGTYKNGPASVAAGKVAGAYDFSNGGYLELSDTSAYNFPLSPNRAFSIDAWVRGTDFGTGVHHIVGKHSPTGSAGYFLTLINGRLALHLHDTTNQQRDFIEPASSSHPPVNDGNWHLVAATVDFSTNKGSLYFDGVPVMTFNPTYYGSTFTGFTNNFGLVIGWAQPQAFGGQIDEVEIFSRALTETDVQGIYAAGALGKCKLSGALTVAISGCGATVSAAGSLPGVTALFFPAGSLLTVDAPPPPDGLVNVSVTMNGATATYTSVPFTFTLDSDATIVAGCPTKPETCLDDPLTLFPGMVGWYTLDETSGTVLSDSSGSPSPLTAGPGFSGFPAAGKVSGGWTIINGTDSGGPLSTTGAPAKYNFGVGDFSLDGWVKFSGGQLLVPLITKMPGAGAPSGFALYTDNGVLRLDLGAGIATPTTWKGSKNIPTDDQWHHFVVTVSRSAGVTFYVDGAIDPFTEKPTMMIPAGISLDNSEPLQLSGVELTLDEIELFNRTLTATEAQTLFLAGSLGKCKGCPADSAPRPPDMAAWWGFDPATAAAITDLSGNSNDGTISGGRAPSSPMVGASFGVTPSNYMTVPHSPSLNIGSGAFSIDMWVKWPANTLPGQNPTLVNKVALTGGVPQGYRFELAPGSAASSGLALIINDANGAAYLWYTGVAAIFSKTDIPSDGQWHLVGVSYTPANGSSMAKVQFYVDGAPRPTGMNNLAQLLTAPNPDNTAPLRVASHWSVPGFLKFSGELDEIELFKRALTADEMVSIFEAGPAGKCRVAPEETEEINVTVNTAVNGMVVDAGLQVVVDGPSYTDSTTYSAPGGSQHSHSTQSQIANGLYYEFVGWTPGTGSGSQTVTLPASGGATYTANFEIRGHVVTLNNSPACSLDIGPKSLFSFPPPPIVMPLGVQYFVLPASGSVIGFTISTGGGPAVAYGAPPLQVGPFNGPITITPICGATVTASYNANSLQAINVTLTNTGVVAATNLRVTGISNVAAASPNVVVFDQGVVGNPGLTFPWLWGDLPGGQATTRTFGFKATAGSISVPFTFDITFEADNMSPITQTISVPFPR